MQSFVTQASEAMALVRRAYPDCTKNCVTIYPCDENTEHNCASYWDSGYRDYFMFVELATGQQKQAPQQSMFDRKVEGLDKVKLPRGTVIVVQHFMGTGKSVSIRMRQEDLNPTFLPLPSPELSEAEKRCLYYTRSRKSSYGGIKEFRRHEAGMSVEAWDAAKASLLTKGLLDKRGALTVNGRNVANGIRSV